MSKKRKMRELTDEHKANISKALLGHTVSKKTRKKMSVAHTGKKRPKWIIDKMIEGLMKWKKEQRKRK
jgi:hypothetical protein